MTADGPRRARHAMEQAIGPDRLSGDVTAYAIDGRYPQVVASPRTIQELSLVMRTAWDGALAVVPWGGGTRMAAGNPLHRLDVVVNLSSLNRVVQHSPADLTATVEAGMTVAGLREALLQQGQLLPLDPPLPHRASVGGTLALGVSGPLQWQYSTPRDLVIGMRVVQADGTVTKSGGQVVKNVSGYDMARLHIGGLGTLGIIAEVSFKLFPLPRQEATLLALFPDSQSCLAAGLAVFQSPVVPLALAALDSAASARAGLAPGGSGPLLAIRLGGRPLALERQVRECVSLCRQHGATGVETMEASQASVLWQGVADFGWDDGALPAMVGRVSLLPTMLSEMAAALEQGGSTGDLRPASIAYPAHGSMVVGWFAMGSETPPQVAWAALEQAREAAHRLGGSLVVERCPQEVKTRLDVWDAAGESLAVMRRLKEQYDSRGVLNPGRFVGGI